MTPQELIDQAAERAAVKASQRLESKAAVEINAMYRKQNREPFGTLPYRITTELAPEPFDGVDVNGDAA